MFIFSFVSKFLCEYIWKFICVKRIHTVYLNICLYNFLDTNLFGYLFVSNLIRMSHSTPDQNLKDFISITSNTSVGSEPITGYQCLQFLNWGYFCCFSVLLVEFYPPPPPPPLPTMLGIKDFSSRKLH